MDSLPTFVLGSTSITLVDGDITRIRPLEAIVSSDDIRISMSGGVSRAIRAAAGEGVQREAQRQLPAHVGDIIVTSGGSLPVRHILHAVVLDWNSQTVPTPETIKEIVINCLREADRRECRSVAFPAFGTGAGGLDPGLAARAILSGIGAWVGAGGTVVQQVYVDILSASLLGYGSFLTEFIRYELARDYQHQVQDLTTHLTQLEMEKAKLQAEIDAARAANDARSPFGRTELPYPLAFAYGLASTHLRSYPRLKAILDAFEVTARYAAVLAVASAVHNEPNTIEKPLEKFRNKKWSFGHWIELGRETARDHSSSFVPRLRELYFRPNGRPGEFHQLLDQAVNRRNDLVHPEGVMPDDAYREDAQKYEQSLQKALRIVAELVPYPLHAVLEYEFAPQDRFAYKMAELTGESILFKTLQVETPERLPRHSIGLWHKDRESLLPLDPFLIFELCPECHFDDTFFLETVDSNKRRTYMSCPGGHKVALEVPTP
ncbi:MAG TPA: hypothetical protein DEV93_09810 [Chloroflexi bacterium]|jgi:O-acetyl-ADP-ribose deacetylase (regulator of RNase III)|nr:hypothetical protein [Chloroflexota bacterium]